MLGAGFCKFCWPPGRPGVGSGTPPPQDLLYVGDGVLKIGLPAGQPSVGIEHAARHLMAYRSKRSACEASKPSRAVPVRPPKDLPARPEQDGPELLDAVFVADQMVEMLEVQHAAASADDAAERNDVDRRL